MGTIKRYETRSIMEYSLPLKYGRSYVRVTFNGGSINSQRTTPASALVKSAVVQGLIEKSPEYKRGIIKLADIIDTDERQAEDCDLYDDITTVTAARNILLGKYQQPLELLQNKKAVLDVAAKLGVKFPNIK